jgi:hypothetical protein
MLRFLYNTLAMLQNLHNKTIEKAEIEYTCQK